MSYSKKFRTIFMNYWYITHNFCSPIYTIFQIKNIYFTKKMDHLSKMKGFIFFIKNKVRDSRSVLEYFNGLSYCTPCGIIFSILRTRTEKRIRFLWKASPLRFGYLPKNKIGIPKSGNFKAIPQDSDGADAQFYFSSENTNWGGRCDVSAGKIGKDVSKESLLDKEKYRCLPLFQISICVHLL